MIFATFWSLVYACLWMPNLVSYAMELDASCFPYIWKRLRGGKDKFEKREK